MSSIGKSISASMLSNMWLVILLLLLTPWYVHFLGVESYGLIGFYAALITILGILDIGISATVTREIALRSVRTEEAKSIPVLFKSLEVLYWMIVIVIGLVALTLAWAFGGNWFKSVALSQETIRHVLMLMSIALIVQMPSGLYSGGLIGLHRQAHNSSLLAFFATLRGVGAILVLWKVHSDVRLFFLWQIMISLLQVSVMRIALWHRINPHKYIVNYSVAMLNNVKGYAGGMTLITALSLAVSQSDKMILSQTVSLIDFGHYMLAWSVASGLMLVAMPLMQTYSPYFTKLISEGNEQSLLIQFRLASQLMSVLVLPPAAFIVFNSEHVLLTWLGDSFVSVGVAPALTLLSLGTMLVACSYPALFLLYSRKQLKAVIIVQLITLAILWPTLVFSIITNGTIGAATCWILFGVITYISYQLLAMRGIPVQHMFTSIIQNFIAPCAMAFFCAYIFWHWLYTIDTRWLFIACLLIALFVTWFATLFVCLELRKIISSKIGLIKVFQSW